MKTRDELWWAYLDGEISPSEATQYDRDLTPENRERAANDLRMETELGEVLAAPVACPDDAWRQAAARIREHENATRNVRRWRALRWAALAVPAAAMLLLAIYVFAPSRTPSKPVFLALKAGDVPGLAARSQVADGVKGVRTFMEERALPVALDPSDPFDGEATPYRLLGAREDVFHGEPVVQLLFECRGKPAMVIIASKQGIAAKEIADGLAAGTVAASRAIGNVLVAAIGDNAAFDLVSVLNDNWPAPSELSAPTEEQQNPEEPEATSETPVGETPQEAPQGLSPESVLPQDTAPVDTPSPVHQEPATPDLPSVPTLDAATYTFA